MAKVIELKAKQTFSDKYTKAEYKKGRVYKFDEKRAEELLKNPYLVEKVSETEVEVKNDSKEEKPSKTNK